MVESREFTWAINKKVLRTRSARIVETIYKGADQSDMFTVYANMIVSSVIVGLLFSLCQQSAAAKGKNTAALCLVKQI